MSSTSKSKFRAVLGLSAGVLALAAGCADPIILDPGNPSELIIQGAFSCPADDNNEPNDIPGAASTLAGGVAAGIRCGDNDDYFAFQVPKAGCVAETALTFDANSGSLQMAILDARGIEVGRSLGAGDRQMASVETTEPGVYFARVFGPGAATTYNIDVNVSCSTELTCPADDLSEPNDEVGTAQMLNSGQVAEGIICAENEDFYAINAEAGCALAANLLFTDEEGDLDLQLLNPDNTVLSTGSSTTDNEEITATATQAGQHFIRVYGFSGAEAGYILTTTSDCGGTVDPIDPIDPIDDGACEVADNNDTALTAEIVDSAQISGVICADDVDFFDTFVPQGCVMIADLEFAHADGDIDLELTGPGGAIEARSISTSDNERIVETAETEGLHVARAYGFQSTTGTPYTYTTDVICRDQLACPTDDPYEQADAWRLEANDSATGIVCTTDDRDVFDVRIGSGCASRVDVDFVDASGDIDINVKKGADVVSRGVTTTDDETVFFASPTAETFSLELRRYGTDNHYNVQVATTCISDLTCADDDVFAPNKSQAEARDISGTGYAAGIACNTGNGVADWFEYKVTTAGCTLNLELKNEFTTGDLDLKLFGPNGQKVAESLTSTVDEDIAFTTTVAGDYTVKIEGFENDTNTYELNVSCD